MWPKREGMPTLFCSMVWLLLWQVNLAYSEISPDLVVETSKGKIQGFESTSSHGKKVSAWYGIPYAQPPVGDLRFRHPRAIDSWEGIKLTLDQPNSCVQIKDTMWPGFEGTDAWNYNTPLSEDCLYLNVVAPRPHPKNAAVILWIYGSGFWGGTTTLDLYDLRTFVSEENIIMVGIQYRVASLSFLYLDEDEAPGNAGMFDQLMAMKWVKDNIEQFGGNPDNITLMGQSAGAASVSLHLLSHLSRDLFSQAIMQSASATVPWGIITKEESMLRGLRLAELMNCPHSKEKIKDVVDCLRRKNATEMVYKEWEEITMGLSISIFTPIVDGIFLDDKPELLLKNKEFKKTNILMGTNKDEGMFFIFYYMADIFPKEEDVFVNRKDFKRSITELNFNHANSLQRKAIDFEYTDWRNPKDPIKNREQVDRFTGDFQFTCPVVDFGHRYAETGNNVYMYHFSQRASVSPWPVWSGALHGDELAFVFGLPLNQSKGYNKEEVKLAKTMMSYWANFAKTGNPSLRDDGTWLETYWPLHTPVKRETLHLNANVLDDFRVNNVLEGFRANKCAFWTKFLPQLAEPSPPPASFVPEQESCSEECCRKREGEVFSLTKEVQDLFGKK